MIQLNHLFRERNFSALILIFVFSYHTQAQQIYINTEWDISNEIIVQNSYVVSDLDPHGNLVYLTNNFNGNNSDIHLSCIKPNGSVFWQNNCSSSVTEDDYGVDIKIDSAGNIFIVGARHNDSNYDYYIAKFTNFGVLIWEMTYDGGNGIGIDIPSALVLTSNNDVVVSGTSVGQNSMTDYLTIRFNGADGSIQWIERLEMQNAQVASSLSIDDNGDIYITGSHFLDLANANIFTVKYNGHTGSQLFYKNEDSPGIGHDKPEKIISDGTNVYIVGTSNSNLIDKNIKVIAYNSSLQLLWEKYIDLDGKADEGNDIEIDQSGNLIITGMCTGVDDGADLTVCSINTQNGNEQWRYLKPSFKETHSSEGYDLDISDNGDIFVCGFEDSDNGKNSLIIKLNGDGESKWIRHYDNSGGTDEANQIIADGQNVYMTGKSQVNGINKITTVKYKIIERQINIQYNQDTIPSHVDNCVIIRFERSKLHMEAIDNIGFETGVLVDFVKRDFIEEMNSLSRFDWSKLPTYKIYRNATSADTISITRKGDKIKLDDFWASLLIELPSIQNEEDIEYIFGSLVGMKHVQTDKVYTFEAAPNDVFYTGENQLGLHQNTIYPNSDINVEDAWDIQDGKNYVKVGVYDEAIDWSHFEFGQSGTLYNSKVKGGWNYVASSGILSGNTVQGNHGTRVAGIIGAHRNDGAGIAGIAGGNLNADPVNQTGVQLYSMVIAIDNNFTTSSLVAAAITQGSVETTNYGFGLHIQNHSYGTTAYPDPEVRKAVKKAFRNLSVFVAARGNVVNPAVDPHLPSWPACYNDNHVLNVIANGTDGMRKDGVSNGNGVWESSYGIQSSNNSPSCVGVDFMAPGVVQLVSTTTNQFDNTQPISVCNVPTSQNNSRYSCFNGTSAAAPHVAGVAALMYSHHVPLNGFPNQLGTEDIEAILEKTANDVGPVGFDLESGYGRIDAYSALKQVDNPYYVIHKEYGESDAQSFWVTNYSSPQIKVGLTPNLNPDYRQMVHADAWQFTWVIDEALPSGHEIIDSWELEARWNVGGSHVTSSNFINAIDQQISNTGGIWPNLGSNTYSAEASTFLYWVTDSDGNQFWYPFAPSDLVWGFSLHVNTGSLGFNENESVNFELYPNPSSTSITVSLKELNSDLDRCVITDASGRIVKQIDSLKYSDQFDFDIQSLESGLYYVTLHTTNGNFTKPFIKNDY